MSDADHITRKLRDVRRRQFLMLFFNSASIGLLAWTFFLFLCRFNFFSLPNPTITVHLITGLTLVTAAFIITVFRMPSLKKTAQLLDSALSLNQRVETSIECIPARDEMDALLLQDTSWRISSILPEEIVPTQFNRPVKVFFLIFLLSVAALGIIRILQSRNFAASGKRGNAMQAFKGSLPQAKNFSKTVPASSQAHNPEKSQSAIANDFAFGSRHFSPKDVASIPERANQLELQSAQSPPLVPAADRGAGGNRNITSAKTMASKPRILPETEKRAANQQSSNLGGVTEENKTSSPGGAAGDNLSNRPNAGAASIRRAEKEAGGKPGASALSEAQANPGGKLSAGQAGLLAPQLIPSGKNAEPSAERLLDHPAFWTTAERALAQEKIPPGLKSYIADYFKSIHP